MKPRQKDREREQGWLYIAVCPGHRSSDLGVRIRHCSLAQPRRLSLRSAWEYFRCSIYYHNVRSKVFSYIVGQHQFFSLFSRLCVYVWARARAGILTTRLQKFFLSFISQEIKDMYNVQCKCKYKIIYVWITFIIIFLSILLIKWQWNRMKLKKFKMKNAYNYNYKYIFFLWSCWY